MSHVNPLAITAFIMICNDNEIEDCEDWELKHAT